MDTWGIEPNDLLTGGSISQDYTTPLMSNKHSGLQEMCDLFPTVSFPLTSSGGFPARDGHGSPRAERERSGPCLSATYSTHSGRKPSDPPTHRPEAQRWYRGRVVEDFRGRETQSVPRGESHWEHRAGPCGLSLLRNVTLIVQTPSMGSWR